MHLHISSGFEVQLFYFLKDLFICYFICICVCLIVCMCTLLMKAKGRCQSPWSWRFRCLSLYPYPLSHLSDIGPGYFNPLAAFETHYWSFSCPLACCTYTLVYGIQDISQCKICVQRLFPTHPESGSDRLNPESTSKKIVSVWQILD